jgi:hypothetical protein
MNNELLIVIFSKNRAMQLHGLLTSIYNNLQTNFNINVLYTYTDESYKNGYELLKNEFTNINYVNENDFETFSDSLKHIFKTNESDFCMFLTDDDLFYNKVVLPYTEINNIFTLTNCITISLRLGLNTTVCYTLNRLNTISKYNEETHIYNINLIEPIIHWKISDGKYDYAYPLSVDGHIFKYQYMKYFVENLGYNNPNMFEAMLCHSERPDMVMSSFRHSKLVNLPLNRVQNTFINKFGQTFKYEEDVLNNIFLDGGRIDLNKMNFDNITSPHQEIILQFKTN